MATIITFAITPEATISTFFPINIVEYHGYYFSVHRTVIFTWNTGSYTNVTPTIYMYYSVLHTHTGIQVYEFYL